MIIAENVKRKLESLSDSRGIFKTPCTENELSSLLAGDSGVTRPEILTSNCHTLAGRRRHLGDHVPIASGRKSAKLKESDFQF